MVRIWLPSSWLLNPDGVATGTDGGRVQFRRVTGEWFFGADVDARPLITIRSEAHDNAFPSDLLVLGVVEDAVRSLELKWLVVGDHMTRREGTLALRGRA